VVGEVLQPQRESRAQLEALKAVMGSQNFSAQYQQDPVPAEGALFQKKWLRSYDEPPPRRGYARVVQSWDTGIKAGDHNDYSACITARVCGTEVVVLDVFRARLEFPDLQRAVIERAREFKADVLLVEDAASGSQLIQQLNAESPWTVPRPIACKPDRDKLARAAGVTPMVEAGGLLLPTEAPWLADFLAELLAFPRDRHDDQVDALTQLLGWVRAQPNWFNPDPEAHPAVEGPSNWTSFSPMVDHYSDDPWRERDPDEVDPDATDEERHPGATVRWGPLQI
jgi:predicted phage terminase large subunit-like protein